MSLPLLKTGGFILNNKYFKCGRLRLRDAERSGCPLTAVMEENILAVNKLIQENRRITH